MLEFIKKLDKKWGEKSVVWLLVAAFILLVLICVSFLGSKSKYNRGMAVEKSIAPRNYFSEEGFGGRGEKDMLWDIDVMKGPGMTEFVTSVENRKSTTEGQLEISVSDISTSVEAISAIAKREGGFVENSNSMKSRNGEMWGSVRLRVPQEKFDSVFSEIQNLGLEVRGSNKYSRDITGAFLNLEASYASLKLKESEYEKILNERIDADSVRDTLLITDRLAEIKEAIEFIQGEMGHLTTEASFASISVSLTSDERISGWKPFLTIKRGFALFLHDATYFLDAIIIFLFRLPVLILNLVLLIVIFLGLWKGFIHMRKAFKK